MCVWLPIEKSSDGCSKWVCQLYLRYSGVTSVLLSGSGVSGEPQTRWDSPQSWIFDHKFIIVTVFFLWYITAKTCTLKGVKSRFLNIIFCHFENHTIGSKPNRCQQTQMHRMIHRQNVFLKKTFWLKKKQKHLFICSSQIYLYSAFRNTVNIVSKQLYIITII